MLKVYKAEDVGAFEKVIEVNNNMLRITFRAVQTALLEDEGKIEKALAKENIITGLWKEKTIRKAGEARDLTAEYKRLALSESKIAEYEKLIKDDSFALDVRDRVIDGKITKTQGIIECLQTKRYSNALIAFINTVRFATVIDVKNKNFFK